MNNYISLHTHSDFSFKDSVANIPKIVKKAKSLNMPAVALTDHGNICGWIKFYNACKEEDIKPIFGVEAYLVDDCSLISRIHNRIEQLETYQETALGGLFEFAQINEQVEKGNLEFNPYTQEGTYKEKDLFDEENNYDAEIKIKMLKELIKKDKRSHHVILLAKNRVGYQNIARISSHGFLKGMYYKPRVDLSVIEKHKEGVIVLSACLAGQISNAIILNNLEQADKYVKQYKKMFGENFYIELQLHEIEEQKKANAELIKLAQSNDVPMVFTQDIHYVEKSDIEIHEAVIKIKNHKKEDDEEIAKTDTDKSDDESYFYTAKELYFKSYDEMVESWKRNHSYITKDIFEEGMKNTIEICNKVEKFSVLSDKPILPTYDTEGLPARQFILNLLRDGAKRKLLHKIEKTPELKSVYDKRMKYELDTIGELGFEQYFLIVWDIIRWCKENDVRTGAGRGSAAGSLIAYLLDITDLDPIEHGLLFERFINKSRSGAKYKIELNEFPLEKKG